MVVALAGGTTAGAVALIMVLVGGSGSRGPAAPLASHFGPVAGQLLAPPAEVAAALDAAEARQALDWRALRCRALPARFPGLRKDVAPPPDAICLGFRNEAGSFDTARMRYAFGDLFVDEAVGGEVVTLSVRAPRDPRRGKALADALVARLFDAAELVLAAPTGEGDLLCGGATPSDEPQRDRWQDTLAWCTEGDRLALAGITGWEGSPLGPMPLVERALDLDILPPERDTLFDEQDRAVLALLGPSGEELPSAIVPASASSHDFPGIEARYRLGEGAECRGGAAGPGGQGAVSCRYEVGSWSLTLASSGERRALRVEADDVAPEQSFGAIADRLFRPEACVALYELGPSREASMARQDVEWMGWASERERWLDGLRAERGEPGTTTVSVTFFTALDGSPPRAPGASHRLPLVDTMGACARVGDRALVNAGRLPPLAPKPGEPRAQLLAETRRLSGSLAVDHERVLFADGRLIRSVPRRGGEPATPVRGGDVVEALARGRDLLFWAERVPRRTGEPSSALWQASADGSSPERLIELAHRLRCLHESEQVLYWLEDDGRVGALRLADRAERAVARLDPSRLDRWSWHCAWGADALLATIGGRVSVVSLSSGVVASHRGHERYTVGAGVLRWIEHTSDASSSFLHVARDGARDGGTTRRIGCGDLALGVGEHTALLTSGGGHFCASGVTFLGGSAAARIRTGEIGSYASDDEAVYLAAEEDSFRPERYRILRIAP